MIDENKKLTYETSFFLQWNDFMITARVTVTLKNGVLDPQGKAIQGALNTLKFEGINSVRQGKVFDIILDETERSDAEVQLKAMCEQLLANLVIENYTIVIN